MHEFESFAYLDVQKTGSMFISYLLDTYCTEKTLFFKKHTRVGDSYDPKKFYFVSARDPLDQYISLYSYGCSGKGGLARRVRRRGHEDLYDSTWAGFKRWLKFVLKPGAARTLDAEYGASGSGALSSLIGFQTYRFLELAMLEPIETLSACTTKDEVRAAYKAKNIVDFTIRHAHFDADVEELLTTRLRNSISDLDAALKFLKEGQHLNVSDRIDLFESDATLGPKHEELLHEREWLLYELFDY